MDSKKIAIAEARANFGILLGDLDVILLFGHLLDIEPLLEDKGGILLLDISSMRLFYPNLLFCGPRGSW